MSRNHATRNNPKTFADLRATIREKATETPFADSQYDYGYLNGWFGARYSVDEIDRDTLDELKNEVRSLSSAPSPI